MKKLTLMLSAAFVLLPCSAFAQSKPSDVVIMRRTITDMKNVVHQATGHWVLGDPVVDAPSCSATAPATMPLTCVDPDGTVLSGDRCSGERPQTATSVADFSSCSYSWVIGEYGPYTPGCSASATRTRDVSCLRSDQVTVPNGSCDQSVEHASSDAAAYYGACTGAWKSSVVTGYCVAKLRPTTTSWACYASGGSGGLETDAHDCDPTKRPANATTNAACKTAYICPAMTGGQYHSGSTLKVIGTVTFATTAAAAALDGHAVCENDASTHSWCTMTIPATAKAGDQINVSSGTGGSYLTGGGPTSYATFTCNNS